MERDRILAGAGSFFQQTEGSSNFVERMNLDGSNRARAVPYAISEIQSVSPDGRWVIAAVPTAPDDNRPAVLAIPLNGGSPRRLCASYCIASWPASGNFLVVQLESGSETSPGRALEIPVGLGESLPDLPPAGIAPDAPPGIVKGSQLMAHENVVPGNGPEHFAYVNTAVHRNLYRISLP